jgi:hypothetical protein
MQVSFRNLIERREFRVYTPDITLDQAKKNTAYVLKIVLPVGVEFL